MLVFANRKLVFLSVPKTGTTAYQEALAPLASMVVTDPPELKHAPVFRYNRFFRPALEKFVGPDLTVLAVMREPVSWLGSWFRYRRRPFLDGHPNSTAGMTFDDFVRAYLQRDRPNFANVGSQAKFLEPQRNGTAVTHLFRYEDQKGLQEFLQARLGCAVAPRPRNTSAAEPIVLSAETDALLRRKCAIEFDLHEGIGADGTYTPPPPLGAD